MLYLGDLDLFYGASIGAPVSVEVDGPGTADIVQGNCGLATASITAGQAAGIVEQEVERVLQSSISSNQSMVRDARERFLVAAKQTTQTNGNGVSVARDIPLDVNGTLHANIDGGSGSGSFYGQWGDYTGRNRTFLTGDFSVQWDADDHRSHTLSTRLGRETIINDTTMLGAFLSFDVKQSKRTGVISGSLDSVTYALGGYAVKQISQDIFLDAWGAYGQTDGSVELHDDSTDVRGNYTSDIFTLGASITGQFDAERYSLWPTLDVAYGNASIHDYMLAGTGSAEIEGTNVTVWRVSATPELRWSVSDAPFGGRYLFAPSLICESTPGATAGCGGGVRFSLRSGEEVVGQSTVFETYISRVNSSNTAGVRLGFEQRW